VQIDALQDWPHASVLSAIDKAVLAYTDAMTVEVQVPDAVFSQVSRALNDDRALVEFTATIGGCNMVARFLEALQITQDGESP
jgi:alkylhydroperoxidase family enzyme